MGNLLTIISATTLLILFPIGEFVRIPLGNASTVTLLDFGVILLFLFSFGQIFTKKIDIPLPFKKELLFFLLICTLSLVIHFFTLKQDEFLTAFLYLVRYYLYTYIYFGLNAIHKKTKQKLLYLSGMLILCIGYFQFFFYPNLRNLSYLGWDPHLNRMFGSLFDPNFFGALLVMFFIAVLPETLRSINQRKKIEHGWIYPITTTATITGIFLTYSRSTYMMLGVSLVAFFTIKKQWKVLLLLGVCCLLIGGLVIFLTANKSEGTRLLRTNSSFARVTSSQDALTIFLKNPILGVGFDAYRYSLKRYHLGDQRDITISHAAAGTDNSFLFVLATTGIIGLSAFVFLWYKILSYTYTNKNAVVFAASAGLIIDSIFINSLFYPFILYWYWTIVSTNVL